ncbi:hypothetical protein CU097_010111 [Rhizopus azygosporus]|uniref:Copper-fist domain-containing protein n=1 Tax=Rhizopus azygosporus TaxID=86630 RepID=A0A367JPB3_RHIAZ|nr:hypothetical protein CU097_010111 [Rhizopus azygosporus]
MVYIKQEDGTQKKFACISCIKGHRSSKCEHVDRELIEIKRKGRPVTQCERCRQLRKTKQMHLKCECRLKQKTLRSIESRDSNLCLEFSVFGRETSFRNVILRGILTSRSSDFTLTSLLGLILCTLVAFSLLT